MDSVGAISLLDTHDVDTTVLNSNAIIVKIPKFQNVSCVARLHRLSVNLKQTR